MYMYFIIKHYSMHCYQCNTIIQILLKGFSNFLSELFFLLSLSLCLFLPSVSASLSVLFVSLYLSLSMCVCSLSLSVCSLSVSVLILCLPLSLSFCLFHQVMILLFLHHIILFNRQRCIIETFNTLLFNL